MCSVLFSPPGLAWSDDARIFFPQYLTLLPDKQYVFDHVLSLDNSSCWLHLLLGTVVCSHFHYIFVCVCVCIACFFFYMNMLMCCFISAVSRDVIAPEGGQEAEASARADHGLTPIWTIRHRSPETSRAPFCSTLHYHLHTYIKGHFQWSTSLCSRLTRFTDGYVNTHVKCIIWHCSPQCHHAWHVAFKWHIMPKSPFQCLCT